MPELHIDHINDSKIDGEDSDFFHKIMSKTNIFYSWVVVAIMPQNKMLFCWRIQFIVSGKL